MNYIITPVTRKLMNPKQASKVTEDGYMVGTIMHEICHGLGPTSARTSAGTLSIRESVGPIYSALEEAKADAAGMFALQWLVDHDVLPKQKLEEYYASYVGDLFRTVRFGIAEAHGQAETMELNYFLERGAITRDASGRYVMDYQKIANATTDLAKELLAIEATGDGPRAESWFHKYASVPPQLKTSLEAIEDIPVDIDPVYSFPEKVR